MKQKWLLIDEIRTDNMIKMVDRDINLHYLAMLTKDVNMTTENFVCKFFNYIDYWWSLNHPNEDELGAIINCLHDALMDFFEDLAKNELEVNKA